MVIVSPVNLAAVVREKREKGLFRWTANGKRWTLGISIWQYTAKARDIQHSP